MKIAIVGAGAIGGYLGVKLALSGVDVTFIARGANLAAIRQNGMTLELPGGETLTASNAKAASMAEAGPLLERAAIYIGLSASGLAAQALPAPDRAAIAARASGLKG